MVRDIDSGASDSPADARTVRYEWDESEQPSMAVIEAVAAATGSEPETLPPLHGVIDSDALDGLMGSGTADDAVPVRLSFTYAGTEVTVSSDGKLVVELDAPASE